MQVIDLQLYVMLLKNTKSQSTLFIILYTLNWRLQGLTAWVILNKISNVKKGDTVLQSNATSAIGQAVVQVMTVAYIS
jgi:NADPH-dependent curcumin reductase CurA